MEGTGSFEVSDFENVIVSGVVKNLENYHEQTVKVPNLEALHQYTDSNGENFYKILNHRGYSFKGNYKNLNVFKNLNRGNIFKIQYHER